MPKPYLLGVIMLYLIFAYPWNTLFLLDLLIEVVVSRLLRLLLKIQLSYYLFSYLLVLRVDSVCSRSRNFLSLFLDHVEHRLLSFMLNGQFTLAFGSYVNILAWTVG